MEQAWQATIARRAEGYQTLHVPTALTTSRKGGRRHSDPAWEPDR